LFDKSKPTETARLRRAFSRGIKASRAGQHLRAGAGRRIYIEKINGPFLYQLKGTPAEYKAGLDLALAKGRLWLHESGTYVKFTEAGAAPFA
jgi:hypothetical protein